MDRELLVFLNGRLTGSISQTKAGKLTLRYEPDWLEDRDSYPLSLSLPLAGQEHGDRHVRPFLEGLLPDSERRRGAWARKFHVSASNPFALLGYVGEDCAGAVQFVRPERAASFGNADLEDIRWLSDAEIAGMLRDVIRSESTGRAPGDLGYFSLAGAQPKIVLTARRKRWGLPSGGVPSTHIVKPPAQERFDGFEINEHACLRLASALGLPVADSSVRLFDDQPAIVVTRYDRATEKGRIARVHQEDACQALSVMPSQKYEAEGGPGAAAIVDLLMTVSTDPDRDVALLWDALALNWIILGTDAHAKNYSLLIRPGSRVALAPFYDIISLLPYLDHAGTQRAKLAMRIDREYLVRKIGPRHWAGLAAECGIDVGPAVERVSQLVAGVPSALSAMVDEVQGAGMNGSFVHRLADGIADRAKKCRQLF